MNHESGLNIIHWAENLERQIFTQIPINVQELHENEADIHHWIQKEFSQVWPDLKFHLWSTEDCLRKASVIQSTKETLSNETRTNPNSGVPRSGERTWTRLDENQHQVCHFSGPIWFSWIDQILGAGHLGPVLLCSCLHHFPPISPF